ncbi:LexA family transcriptional regulator [Roseomonas elaeocarpi]|uniref:Helix-turn-helix transcriptional regulator n=1 Tax=Roseomonas elaeocarpi TaxID=907779 RepID=A0ABV6JQE4_9PROT
MANRFRELREALGWSRDRLAAEAEINPTTVWRYENGTAPLLNDAARKMAAALGVRREEEVLLPPTSSAARLIGRVGAGAEVYPIDDGSETIPAPPTVGDGIAVRVVGTSMVPAYREGDVLFAEQAADAPEVIIGRDCILQISDGRRLVKKVLRGSEPGRFRLFSYETQDISDDVELVWAAPVRWVLRDP